MSSFDIKILGQRLRAIRKDLGMTQVNVAKELGVAQSLVSKVEQGQPVLSPVVIGYIFLFADRININYLMGERFEINDKDALYDVNFSITAIIGRRWRPSSRISTTSCCDFRLGQTVTSFLPCRLTEGMLPHRFHTTPVADIDNALHSLKFFNLTVLVTASLC